MTPISNPFKQLSSQRDVPGRLKNSVMRDIGYIRFFAEIADLFSLKYAATVQNIFLTDAGKKESGSDQ
ncbi:MAG: hypothetical protein ACK4E0_13380 [Chitinophagaceae bacterium]|jgi:hypothetical protein